MKETKLTHKIPIIDLSAHLKELRALFINHNITNIPVLDDDVYMGLINADVIETLNENTVLSEIKHLIRDLYLYENYTVFDWLKLNSIVSLDYIPIVQQKDALYLGSVDSYAIFEKFKGTGLIVDLSSIIVLRKPTSEFTYSEVFQIAEANGARIFGSYIQESSIEHTEIVLNIHHIGLNELLQSYRRYNFDVVSYHDEDQHHETLKANSDYFSKYLTV